MELFYSLCLFMALFYLVCLLLITVSDCNIITLLASYVGTDPERKYRGKVVWVTGASSGIGEALGKALACCGAKVVLSARRKDELERVKYECLGLKSEIQGEDILVLPLDVTDIDSQESALNTVLDHFGKLDVLISNAGKGQKAHWHDTDLSVDKEIFDLNVFSLVNMNRLVMKHFLKQGSGQIGVMSSLCAFTPAPFSGTYAASKAAIHGYFDALRSECLQRNISVTLICPGPVETPIFEKVVGQSPNELAVVKYPSEFKFLTPARCAYLSLVAMANKLDESWVAARPCIQAAYLYKYFPVFSAYIEAQPKFRGFLDFPELWAHKS